MTFLILVSNEWLLPFATVIAISSAAVLIFSKRHRNALLNGLRIRRRRTSVASTPPRSFSPILNGSGSIDKKEPIPSAVLSQDFLKTFPPSRRSALLELTETTSLEKLILIGSEPSQEVLQENALPTTHSYSPEDEAARYTPTGFTVAEIKALGDFPAYDVLSGVPLPQPYQNFDPDNALPRPYRPFRWMYHQTMCKYLSNIVLLRFF
jgi:hypothetical protein